jgi:hypothetical protein
MDEREQKIVDGVKAALTEIGDLAKWFRLWNAAWDLMAIQGHCEEILSQQYCRCTAEARFFGVPADAREMETWICLTANDGPANDVIDEQMVRKLTRAGVRKDVPHA